jgi:hypothetical protein
MLADKDRKIKELMDELERQKKNIEKYKEGLVKSKIKGDDRILD